MNTSNMAVNINCHAELHTPAGTGAIAVIQLSGEVTETLNNLTSVAKWRAGQIRLVSFDSIDEGVVLYLSESCALLMPHGSMLIVQKIFSRLQELGVSTERSNVSDAISRFPEAADKYEALTLQAISNLASPLGLKLLLDQPERWRNSQEVSEEDEARSERLNRLITPPTVVVAGAANTGKSTLSNALLGRSMSITQDMPGTTRDYTTARINLNGLVVNWIDTPGLRETNCEIEHQALKTSQTIINNADFLIALTDHTEDWPKLNHDSDLKVANKSDIKTRNDCDISISATTSEGIEQLVSSIKERLVPAADLEHAGVWLFDPQLV